MLDKLYDPANEVDGRWSRGNFLWYPTMNEENTIRSNILNNHKLENNIILRNVDLAFNNIADRS